MTPVTEPPAVVRILAWAAGLWLVVASVVLTDASCNFFVGFALAAGWLYLAMGWTILALTEPAVLHSPSSRRRWLAAGLICGLGPLLAFTDVGLIARVALSESSLAAYVEGVGSGGGWHLHDVQRVGLFLVDGEEQQAGVVLLYTSRAFIDREGIAYVPAGTTPDLPWPKYRLRPLFGPWHQFTERF